jgi:uncharacterized RDD family membrane protein YckC
MTCPTCGGELAPGVRRCPVCEPSATPRVEGALAADPRLVTPPARAKARQDPLRDAPALRHRDTRDRSWRDEVQERVRSRRQKRAEAGLPLFDEPAPPAPSPAEPPARLRLEAVVPGAQAEARPAAREAPAPADEDPDSGLFDEELADAAAAPLLAPELSEVELADLPLRPSRIAGAESSAGRIDHAASRAETAAGRYPEVLASTRVEPEIEIAPPAPQPVAVERPARAGERAQAAALDAALFALLCLVVLYFTGRTARVGLLSLASAWPWLAAYQGLLALFYAGYFTGTTGQTPGKLITGLRVVDTGGRPPGYSRAAARAVTGFLGIALAGVALLPMAFDPALRALHDRLFQTRVVKG